MPQPNPRAELARRILGAVKYGDAENLMTQYGSPEKMYDAVDATREGGTSDKLQGRSKEELAELDRFAQFAILGRKVPSAFHPVVAPVAALIAAANEGSKAIPGAQNAIAYALNEPQFQVTGSTSAPSLANVLAALKGYTAGAMTPDAERATEANAAREMARQALHARYASR